MLLFPALAVAQQTPQALVTQPVDNSARTRLAGNIHPLARAEFDRGEAPAGLALNRMLLVLKRSPQQEIALSHFIEIQQSKGAAEYHQWLQPEEFGTRFGPADSDIAAVVAWLTASGFQVGQISEGRTVIEFSGSAGQVKQAFGTAIHQFVVNGENHWANVSDTSIPVALAGVVAGIDSLHDFRKKAGNQYLGIYSEKTKSLSATPLYTISLGNETNFAVSPYDFATIYDLLPLWNAAPTHIDGTGQTIAIIGRTDIDPTDATGFWSLFGLDGVHAPQPTLVITHNGPAPGFTDDESEADIDTQWAGAAAPGATINFVTSESTETTDGVDLSSLYAVDHNLAPIISDSYGLCEAVLGSAGNSFYYALWEQAAAQGISVFVSTGDSGAAACDDPDGPASHGLNVSGLASTPFNAAIGGTDFNEYNKWNTYWNATNDAVTQRSAKGYIPETTWNDSCTNSVLQFLSGGTTNAENNCNNFNFNQFVDSIGGSGGKSATWLKPAWQTGTPADNARDLPDVSLFASNGFLGSYYLICEKDRGGGCDLNSLGAFGGTSVSTPAFAGIMALVDQKTGSSQGVPGFVLYKLAASKPGAFHDVPAGSTIAMPCLSRTPNCNTVTVGHQYGVLSGYATGTGYDLATGLGSVDAANLVNNWSTITFTPSTTVLSLNSGAAVNVTHGGSVPVGITVTPATPAPTGAVALLVNPGTPGNPGFDAFNLSGATITSSTSVLPGGSYSVIAHYSGDAKYGGSYSAPVSVTVNPENSSVFMPGVVTDVDSVGNPIYSTTVVYAVPYLLRADVKNSQNAFCLPPPIAEAACPTGNVTFTDNGSPLDGGSFGLNGLGFTEDQTIQLSGGTHTLVAQYAGDASFNPSSASSVIVVSPASTGSSGLSLGNAIVGNPFGVGTNVTTTSTGVAPTGSVTFYSNGVPLTGIVEYFPTPGSPPHSFASLNTSLDTVASPFPVPGIYTITAQYSGDVNYQASSAPAQQITVMFQRPSLTMQSSEDPATPGTSGVLTATVVSGSRTIAPTGSVVFRSVFLGQLPETPAYKTITDSNGNLDLQASLAYNFDFDDAVNATYSGDANYPGSFTDGILITVSGVDFKLSFPQNVMLVSKGQGNTLTMLVQTQSDTPPPIFACSGLPAESVCSFYPTGATGTGAAILTVQTSAPHQVAKLDSPGRGWAGLWAILLGTGLGAVVLVGAGRQRNAVFSLALCAVLLGGFGCGGGSAVTGGGGGTMTHTDPGTPSGSYTVSVTGTSGSITRSASFTLTVQ